MHANIILSENISMQITECILLLISIVPIIRKRPAAPLAHALYPPHKDPMMQTSRISFAALT